jgi:hypothetical protein
MELEKVAPATLRALQSHLLTSFTPISFRIAQIDVFLARGRTQWGAVRAAPTRAGCAVFPAWSRERRTKFARRTLNVEPPNTIRASKFPPEPPKMTFSWHGDAPTGGALYPRQQLPPSPTPRTAGLPEGQARARRLQVRAAIVDTKWQRRANTVWNQHIRSQLPVAAVPPPPAAPGRGGGNTRGVFGVLVGMLGQGMSVCK